jgi:hypothetical protein
MPNALAAAVSTADTQSPELGQGSLPADGEPLDGTAPPAAEHLPLVLVTTASTIGGQERLPAVRRSRRGETGLMMRTPDPINDLIYRFPCSRSGVEIVPDIKGTFCVRVLWHKGKAVITIAESTPLRPLGRISFNSQTFDVFFSEHDRKKRERILLAGRRKVAIHSSRAFLRYNVSLTGRDDRYTWRWRIGATAPALGIFPSAEAEAKPLNEVRLYLPFAAGKAHVLALPGTANGCVLWLNDVAMTVVVGRSEGGGDLPALTWDGRGFELTLQHARFGGEGVTLEWQMWLSAARTEAEARAALLRHLADAADQAQILDPDRDLQPDSTSPSLLRRAIERSEAALMDEAAIEKRGVDRLMYRENNPAGATPAAAARSIAGETVDCALAASALLCRFYQTGDDALRRRARLLANGTCAFQVNDEESRHWGAIWDAAAGKGRGVVYEDVYGTRTLSVATAARAAKGLHLLGAYFGVELYKRTALAATQWLILKMDRDGYIPAERFTEDGPPVEETNSPWIVGEALLPLVETFRATGNEVFFKAAMRAVHALRDALNAATLPFERASTEQLASAIEGVLQVSREYEKEDIVALARQLGLGLRARRLPDGSLTEPTAKAISSLSPTLAGARASLAISRVDADPLWISFAHRALRAANQRLEAASSSDASKPSGGMRSAPVQLADHASFLTLSVALLLAVAARAPGCVADRDKVTITRGWQTFGLDPATREYIRVFAPGPDGAELPVDYLALVCPVSMQVMIAVLAPTGVAEVKIVKNSRTPFVKNLLTGDFDMRAPLSPLGESAETNIGVFLADT